MATTNIGNQQNQYPIFNPHSIKDLAERRQKIALAIDFTWEYIEEEDSPVLRSRLNDLVKEADTLDKIITKEQRRL